MRVTVDRCTLERLVDCATAQGAGSDALRELAGLEREVRPRVDASVLPRVWSEAVAQTHSDLPWCLAESTPLSALGLFAFAAQTASSARSALSTACQLFGLVSGWLRWAPSDASVQIMGSDPRTAGELLVREAMVTQFVSFSLRIAPELRVARVQLTQARASRSPLETLGCRVEAGAPVDRIEWQTSTLDSPTTHAHPELHHRLVREALGSLPPEGPCIDWPRAVEQALLEAMGDGPSIELVARRLGVAPRTLRRRLAEEGRSFRGVLDALRKALARQAVCASQRPISQVALDLGFSELSAFSRAYRRWFGVSPTDARTDPEGACA